tara:strand:+ start:117 stop:464 length:348 start_codon:yes stop_codon:yes gene_type:complete
MGKRFFKRYKRLDDDSNHRYKVSNTNKNNEPQKKPGFVDLASNLTKALVEWQRAGRPVVTSEQWNTRLTICRSCEFWREFKETKIAKCTKCGCSSGKLLLATSKCPLSPPKWESV